MITRDDLYFFSHLPMGRLLRVRYVVEEEIRAGLMIRPALWDRENGVRRWDNRAAISTLRMIVSSPEHFTPEQRYDSAVALEDLYYQMETSRGPQLSRAQWGDIIQEGNVG